MKARLPHLLFLAIVSFFLASCYHRPPPPYPLVPPGCLAPPPPAPLRINQCSIEDLPTKPPFKVEEAKITSSFDITLYQQGSKLLIIIPVDDYFEPASSQIKMEVSRYIALRQVGEVVRKYSCIYPNAIIQVRGFTDSIFHENERLILSRQYANVIATYLLNAGVAPDRLMVRGYGSRPSIASQHTVAGRGLNRRVEIRINYFSD